MADNPIVRTIRAISCIGFQLQTVPSRHYTYIVQVKWKDQESIIYRRYSQFFNLHCELMDMFPEEAGAKDPSKRKIPFLPGKKLVGNLNEKTAEKRQHKFDQYFKGLIEISTISKCELFLSFCQTRESDVAVALGDRKERKASFKCEEISGPLALPQYTVIASYTKQKTGELSVASGSDVYVVEKKSTGWWLVQTDDNTQGWVPAAYLEGKYDTARSATEVTELNYPEKHIATCDYTASQSDELNLFKGALVDVMKKSVDGWWKCRCNGQIGLAPAAYLCKADSRKAKLIKSSIKSSKQPLGPALSEVNRRQRVSKYAPPRPKRSPRPPRPSTPPKHKSSLSSEPDKYVALEDFTGDVKDSVTLRRGDLAKIIRRDSSGWWFVEVNGNRGWAPSTYLELKS